MPATVRRALMNRAAAPATLTRLGRRRRPRAVAPARRPSPRAPGASSAPSTPATTACDATWRPSAAPYRTRPSPITTSAAPERRAGSAGPLLLDDRVQPVHRQVFDRLLPLARGPGDRDGLHGLGFAQADRGDQAVAAEAGAAADDAVDPPRGPVELFQFDADPGADGRAVGLGPHQLELDPVVVVARVPEQDVVCLV